MNYVATKLTKEGYPTILDSSTVTGISLSEEKISLSPTNKEGDKVKDITISLSSGGNDSTFNYLVTINSRQYKLSYINNQIDISDEPISKNIESKTYSLVITPADIVKKGFVNLSINRENITDETTVNISNDIDLTINTTTSYFTSLRDLCEMELKDELGNRIGEKRKTKILVDQIYSTEVYSSNYQLFLKENGELDIPSTFIGDGNYSTVDGRKYKITNLSIRGLEQIKGLIIPETITRLSYDACWYTGVEYVIYKGKTYCTDRELEANTDGLYCPRAFEDTPMYVCSTSFSSGLITKLGLIDENGVLTINKRIKGKRCQYDITLIFVGTLNNTTAKHIIIGDGIPIISEQNVGCGNLYRNMDLETISFGKDINSMPADNLYSNPKLHSITVSEDNQTYKSVGGILYSKDMTQLYAIPRVPGVTHFVIPETVQILGDNSMRENTQITEITLPNNLKSVGSYTFYGMSNLKTVHYKGNTYTKYKDLEKVFTENGVSYNYYSCLYYTGLK